MYIFFSPVFLPYLIERVIFPFALFFFLPSPSLINELSGEKNLLYFLLINILSHALSTTIPLRVN